MPQGKFRDFLVADSAKRTEILNVIFNATLYAKIEQGLKDRAKKSQAACENFESEKKILLTEAAEVSQTSAEDLSTLLKNLEEKFHSAQAEVERLKFLADKAREDLSAGEILTKNFQDFESAEKKLNSSLTELKKISAQYDSAKVEFDKQKNSESLRKETENKIDSLNKIETVLAEFRKKQLELSAAESEETSAREKISKLERLQEKCESRLAELKNSVEKLQGADAKLKDAEQILLKAQDRQVRLKELARLNDELGKAQVRLAKAEKNFDDAKKTLERLNFLQRASLAAKLAADLAEGEPCPVCGATIHPKLALAEEYVPTDDEISKSEVFLKRMEIERDSQVRSVTSTSAKINSQEEELKKIPPANLEEAQKIFDAAEKSVHDLEESRKNLRNGEAYTKKNLDELEQQRKILAEKSKLTENLRGTLNEKKNQIPPEYLENAQKISDDLAANRKTKKFLDDAWKSAEENFYRLERLKSAQEGKIKTEQLALNDAAEKISGKEKPDLDALKNSYKLAAESHSKSVAETAKLETRTARLKKISEKLEQLAKKISAAEEEYRIWRRLSETADGKNNSKISFQRYYLNAMFRDIIREANERLEKMSSGRYRFREMETAKKGKQTAGLDLEIFDAYTGKARPVETLSGGESFLASLSLALGLAAVVKNSSGGIKLETIFIDEGFGSLDSETLDTAISTLEELQTGGRLVGIISHVDELKQRIPARLEVRKTKSGSTAKFINANF